MRRLATWVSSVVLVSACGDEGPSSPSTPAPVSRTTTIAAGTMLSVVSGETGEAVPGARMVVAGRELMADGDGRLALPDPVSRDSFLDILAAGFLDRQTSLRDGQSATFTLWPAKSPSGLDEAFTTALVYSWARNGVARPLIRLRPGVAEAYVVAKEPLRSDPAVMDTVARAAAAIREATRGEIAFHVTDEPPSSAVVFELVVDPGDPAIVDAVAVAKRRLDGWVITGGTVVYATAATARTSTTLHELGHMFGLGHSPSRQEVMFGGRSPERIDGFSPRESLAMQLMLQRPPGNDRPDNDRGVSSSSFLRADGAWVSTVSCAH